MGSKRLIICCDGTWQDATDDDRQPPSNVTRLSRALKRTATVKENGVTREIPQIVYYQKGVGTGLGDKYFGGVTGVGLSANVRAAYGFLAENYEEGDKIYFFGFSRGAYTARAVAGLVCDLGLLTTRGMDNFSNVYNDFYNRKKEAYTPQERKDLGFRPPLPRFTVEVIGVWDTVAFHKPWLGQWFGEQLEFRNTLLSREVKHAYHALALDEERTAYQPTLWHQPDNSEGTELLQVWFSGVHTDIGGGADEPRLSNISLAWMIAQCSKYNQLEFDIPGYLFDIPPRPTTRDVGPWATLLGKIPRNGFMRKVENWVGGTSVRTPLAYDQPGTEQRATNECIHASIRDRVLGKVTASSPKGAVQWVSPVVAANTSDWTRKVWKLKGGGELFEDATLDAEFEMKGRIRTVHWDAVDQMEKKD